MHTMCSSLKAGFYELGGCSGCTFSFIQNLENLKKHNLEIVYFPALIDITEIPDMDILFISGAVCKEDKESVEKLLELRKKAKTIVAFGSCASVGGIMNFLIRGGQEPKPWQSRHFPLSEFIKVDRSVMGCPPGSLFISQLVNSLKSSNNKFDLFKFITRFKRLSCFNLLDEVIIPGLCVGCGVCAISCPTKAIVLIDGLPEFKVEKCIRCGLCYIRCPQNLKKWRQSKNE